MAGQRCRHRPRGRGRSGAAHRVPARQRGPHRAGGRLARRWPGAVHRLPLRQRRPPDPGAHAVRRRRRIDHRLPRRRPADDRSRHRPTGRRRGLAGGRRCPEQCLGRHIAGRHADPPELRGARQRTGLHHPGRGCGRCGDRRGRDHRRRPATGRHRRHGAGPQHAGRAHRHAAARQRSGPQAADAERQRCGQPAHQPGRRPGPRWPHRRQRFHRLGSRGRGRRLAAGRSGRRRRCRQWRPATAVCQLWLARQPGAGGSQRRRAPHPHRPGCPYAARRRGGRPGRRCAVLAHPGQHARHGAAGGRWPDLGVHARSGLCRPGRSLAAGRRWLRVWRAHGAALQRQWRRAAGHPHPADDATASGRVHDAAGRGRFRRRAGRLADRRLPQLDGAQLLRACARRGPGRRAGWRLPQRIECRLGPCARQPQCDHQRPQLRDRWSERRHADAGPGRPGPLPRRRHADRADGRSGQRQPPDQADRGGQRRRGGRFTLCHLRGGRSAGRVGRQQRPHHRAGRRHHPGLRAVQVRHGAAHRHGGTTAGAGRWCAAGAGRRRRCGAAIGRRRAAGDPGGTVRPAGVGGHPGSGARQPAAGAAEQHRPRFHARLHAGPGRRRDQRADAAGAERGRRLRRRHRDLRDAARHHPRRQGRRAAGVVGGRQRLRRCRRRGPHRQPAVPGRALQRRLHRRRAPHPVRSQDRRRHLQGGQHQRRCVRDVDAGADHGDDDGRWQPGRCRHGHQHPGAGPGHDAADHPGLQLRRVVPARGRGAGGGRHPGGGRAAGGAAAGRRSGDQPHRGGDAGWQRVQDHRQLLQAGGTAQCRGAGLAQAGGLGPDRADR